MSEEIKCPWCKSPDYTIIELNKLIKEIPSIVLCIKCHHFYKINVEFILTKMKLVDDDSSIIKPKSNNEPSEKTSILSIRKQAKMNRELCWRIASEGYDIDKIVELTGFNKATIYQYLNRMKRSKGLKIYPGGFKIGSSLKKKKKTTKKKNKIKDIKDEKKKDKSESIFDKNGNLKIKTRIIGQEVK